MAKIKLNMLSYADKIEGQGMGSAYLDLLSLLREKGSEDFDIYINSKKKPDIVHIHSIDPINYFRFKRSKAIKVVSVHFLGDTLRGAIKLPNFMHALYKWFMLKVYKCADYLVIVNPTMKDYLIKEGFDASKIIHIPNYVSDDNFYPMKKEDIELTKKQYNVPKSSLIVLGVGQIVKRKGILDFIEVAKKLPDVTFVWCGALLFGPLSEDYGKLKEAYDHSPKNVKFLGQVPRSDMNAIYNMADVIFVPSHDETFGIVILEGAIVAKPIIARRLSIYDELFFDNCLYGDNNQDFIKYINLLKHKKEYDEQVEKSIRIKEHFNKNGVYKMWFKFYHDILKNKNI